MEITIKDLWATLKKSILIMLICALAFGATFYVYSSRFTAKVYSTSVDYILTPRDGSIEDEEKLNNYLVVGVKCIPTLENMLMSEKTMKYVLEYIEGRGEHDPEYKTEKTYSAAGLLGCFSFTWDNPETLMFTVRCRASSSADARILLDAFSAIINERSAGVLNGVFNVETCFAPKNGAKISPNETKNALLGAVIGATLAYVVVLAITIFDTRVKSEKDLKSRFAQTPVLGQIPYIS